MICYRNTSSAGLGVFATRRIDAGALIERVPVIVISASEAPQVDKTIIASYAFAWAGAELAIALGLGSIYNHSYQPNAQYLRRLESREMEFVALAPIAVGDEVCVNYNGDPADQSRIDFEGVRWRQQKT